MAQPYVGQIALFAGNFPPVGWEFCNGQLLPISENDTLYQLIGTIYGGDGQSTFALPDLRGRVPLHQGTDSEGQTYVMGQTGGVEQVTVTEVQMPAHSHPVQGTTMLGYGANPGNSGDPQGRYPAITPGKNFYSTSNKTGSYMTAPSGVNQNSLLTTAGGGQHHNNMQPYLAVNYIISLFGIFPSIT